MNNGWNLEECDSFLQGFEYSGHDREETRSPDRGLPPLPGKHSAGTYSDLCGLSGKEGGGYPWGPQTPQEPPTAVYSPDTAGQSERERDGERDGERDYDTTMFKKRLLFYGVFIFLWWEFLEY